MNLQKSYIVVQNFMKQCNLRGLPRAQRVPAAFKVVPGSLRIKSTTQKKHQLAPHFLILVYQQFLTTVFHLICLPRLPQVQPAMYLFNWFTVLTPHQTPITYPYPISLFKSMYLIGNCHPHILVQDKTH